ncbi:MAG: hypothetical protein JWP02_3808, partial [Acidimicrobiales bacterium]|nr:hypothetical protein [Acidimicrobiales bacterium]
MRLLVANPHVSPRHGTVRPPSAVVSIRGVVTPTASLLWAACRPEPDLEGVRTAVRDGADMPGAAQTAVVQRVSPLLWRALMASGAADESDDREWAVMLRRDSARCRAQALLVLPRLAPTALVPLAEASLVPLVFKGAALAGRYPGAGLRPMDDVDLVLPPQQLGRAVETLEAVGWRVVPVPLHVHHEVTLVHDALPGLPLELHRALATWRQRSNHLTTADLWTWRRESTVSGVSVFVLPPAEEIVALAAHAAKPFHVFDRLVWAVDVAVVISDADRSGGGIDWDRVAELARVTRCSTAVAVALGQARRLGAESPEALRRCPVDARGQALA